MHLQAEGMIDSLKDGIDIDSKEVEHELGVGLIEYDLCNSWYSNQYTRVN